MRTPVEDAILNLRADVLEAEQEWARATRELRHAEKTLAWFLNLQAAEPAAAACAIMQCLCGEWYVPVPSPDCGEIHCPKCQRVPESAAELTVPQEVEM